MVIVSEYADRKKVGGTLVWTLPMEKKEVVRPKSSGVFAKYAKLYCENSSLAGYKYLTEPDRTWVERMLWITVHAITLCSMGFIVYGACKEYVDTPIVTMVDTDSYPADNLEFPGVAICTINRISRRAAEQLAAEVSNVTDQSYEEILYLIAQLGSLYESTFTTNIERGADLDYLLRKYYSGDYNVTDILYRLTPQCADVLQKCLYNSDHQNCSTLFMFRKTQNGFCCTFNYAREIDDIPTMPEKMDPIEAFRIKDLGIDRGLTVVMEPFLDDYFYTMLPITGWKVTIFNPRDYPDETSGGVTEVLASPQRETSLELDAVSFYSTSRVRGYSIDRRKCIFASEGIKAGYTYSDCIVDCKVDEIWQIYSKRICNTADVPCLQKYKSKWWSVLPNDISKELESFNSHANMSWSLHCKRCYPSCEDVHYSVRSWSTSLNPGIYMTGLLNNVTVVDQGIVNVYFANYGTIRLKQDVAYSWYDLMSNIGGICGVFIGFSLISVVELAYFSVLLLLELCRRSSPTVERRTIDPQHRSDGNDGSTVRTIYWSELLPRARILAEHDEFRSRKRVCY